MWRFVAPAYKSEKVLLPFLLASPLMFFLVFLLLRGYTITFDFFLGFQQPGSLESGESSEAGTAE